MTFSAGWRNGASKRKRPKNIEKKKFTFGVGSSSHNSGNRPITSIVDRSAFTAARAQMAVQMQPMEGMGGNTGVVWIWSATSSLPLMKPTGLSRAWTCTAAPMLQCLAFNRSWALSVYDVFHHVFQVIHSMYLMDSLRPGLKEKPRTGT